MIDNHSSHIVSSDTKLIEALGKLNALSGSTMTLFVVDRSGKMLGTLTDGDLRRALVGGASLDAPVAQAMHTDFCALMGKSIDVQALREFRGRQIKLVPWLNPDGTIREIVDLSVTHTRLPLSAVIMAGGQGERLRPLTLHTPKPLLKVGGKAIIDYNVEALAKCGIEDITVTTRYLSEQLYEHFSSSVGGVMVKCVKEEKPLGTIGSAALANLPEAGHTIVMNSDLLTSISFEDMYLHHKNTSADITIAAIPYQVSVPYAILTPAADDPSRITSLEEKPSYSFFANAGIYIFPNDLLRSLPTYERTDATDLVERAIAQGMKVTQFPLNGTWIDIGTPTDFQQASQLIKYVQKTTIF